MATEDASVAGLISQPRECRLQLGDITTSQADGDAPVQRYPPDECENWAARHLEQKIAFENLISHCGWSPSEDLTKHTRNMRCMDLRRPCSGDGTRKNDRVGEACVPYGLE